jgi:hypothetical protein
MVKGNPDSCYIAIFAGDACSSDGGIYQITTSWYSSHFGGNFGVLGSCGEVIDSWFVRSGGHRQFASSLATNSDLETPSLGTLAKFTAQLACGPALQPIGAPTKVRTPPPPPTATSTTMPTPTPTHPEMQTPQPTLSPLQNSSVPTPTVSQTGKSLRLTSAAVYSSGVELRALQVEGALAGPTVGGVATSEKRTIYFFKPDGELPLPTFRGSTWPIVYLPAEVAIDIHVDSVRNLSVSYNENRVLLIDNKPAYQFVNDADEKSASGHALGGVWFAHELQPISSPSLTTTTTSTPPMSRPTAAPTPASVYRITQGQCRSGRSWSSGSLWDCSLGMMSDYDCQLVCDANSECAAYDMPASGTGECCLFKSGNTGNGHEGRVCKVKAGATTPTPPPPAVVRTPRPTFTPRECPDASATASRMPCQAASTEHWTLATSCRIVAGSYSIRKLTITNGAVVDVEPGATVSLDVSGGILVDENSELWAGCEAAPFTGSFTVTFSGSIENLENPDQRFGVWTNALINKGRLELHGLEKTSWAYLRESSGAGSTKLIMDREPVNWTPGDEVVIAQSGKDTREVERAVIASVSGDVVNLENGVQSSHDGYWTGRGSRLNAEVGILSRNIKLTSNVDYAACENAFGSIRYENSVGAYDNTKRQCFGGQTTFLQHSVTHIEHVELEKMGQGLQMGRYAFHFHLAGDVNGSYLRSNSVHRSFSRCVTLHGVFNAVVDGNVCFDNRGHNMYLEDAIEAGNAITNNLIVNPKPSGTICTDRNPSGLWITNPNNTFIGNAVVGAHFGAWFTFPTADGAHPFSGEKRGQLGGVFGASQTHFLDASSGYGPDSWVLKQEQARTPSAGFNMNAFKCSQSSGITIDFRVYDSEDPHIPCFEGSAYGKGPCPTCANVGHTFSWAPMKFDTDVQPGQRWYQPVANVFEDIIIAHTATRGDIGESFSFWATGGSVKFERPIFVDNSQGSSLGFTGECAAGTTFGHGAYNAQWSHALFIKGAPPFKLYDGGYNCVDCRWAELESVVNMRPGSPGNVNGVLFERSAPLGWFDSDATDPLYKWVFDSRRVEMQPRASSVDNMVDWSSRFLSGPNGPTWQSADVNIMVSDGFGDALQTGFLQLKYSGEPAVNNGWGKGAEVDATPKCRQFYPCNRGMWCGDGANCDRYVRCADIPNKPTCCLNEWVGQR